LTVSYWNNYTTWNRWKINFWVFSKSTGLLVTNWCIELLG